MEILRNILLWLLDVAYDLTCPFVLVLLICVVIIHRRYHFMAGKDEYTKNVYLCMSTLLGFIAIIAFFNSIIDVIYLFELSVPDVVQVVVDYFTIEHHTTLASYLYFGFFEHPVKTAIYLIYLLIAIVVAVCIATPIMEVYKEAEDAL